MCYARRHSTNVCPGNRVRYTFKRTYNEQWMLEKYAYRSPAQVRRDLVGLDAAA